MKTHQFCPACLGERGPVYCSLEITEDDAYEMRCSFGHVSFFAGSQDKYVVLGSLAFEAFIDEYYMQTVGALWTSLERCFEWYLRVVFTEKFQNLTNFDVAWMHVKRSSERQLGMFLATYTNEENEAPPLPASAKYGNLVDLRNKVIHQGYIPPKDKVEQYCNEVIRIIQHIEKVVRYKHGRGEEWLRQSKMIAAQKKLGIGGLTPLYGMVENPFWINQNGIIRSSISEIVDYIKMMRDIRGMNFNIAADGSSS